jgi:Acetyl xylan esterase (AXE1)
MRGAVNLVAGLVASIAVFFPAVAAAQGPAPAPSSLYTASDFPALARGVDPGFTGDASVSVWAPWTDGWKLSAGDDGTITLKLEGRSGSTTPVWQSLGTIKLVKDRPFKVVVTYPEEPKKSASSEKGKRRPPRPVPALLRLATRLDQNTIPEGNLHIVRTQVDSIEPSPDRRRVDVRTNYQGADFQAPRSAEAWRDRAAHLREQMLVTLGLWPMFPRTPMNPRVYGKLKRDGYTIEKVVLETFPGFTLSGNLYRPAEATGRVPGILCPHGHWDDGRVNPEVQQRCIRWAKLGCVVFLYDMVGYNDSKPFTHAFLDDQLRRWGLSLPTLQTWNSIRALDWLTSLPDVDVARIGCTGESGGGTQTFLLTALDDRIKVAAPVVMVSDTFQGGCVCENAAGLRHGTDNVEFAAMCAPRPLVLVGASGDWTKMTMERAYPAIRGVYSLVGSTDRVGAQVFDFPHNYNQTTRNAVYAAMGHWLLGIEDPDRTREGQQQTEKPGDLFTFDTGHPAPPSRKTPEQLGAYLIGTRQHQLAELAPSGGAARWEAGRRVLLTSLKVRTGIINPPPDSLDSREVRRLPREDFTIVHTRLGRASTGEAIPVVRLIPGHPSGRLTVVAHPRGKAALASGSGEPTGLVRALLAHGHEVVGFDPLLVGESLDPRDPATHRPEAVHFETYNPCLAADQMQDLATVLAWCRAQGDVREVNLVALDTAGYQALVARPVLEGLARTVVEATVLPKPSEEPFKPTMRPWPATIDLPGLEQFGGPRAAAALSAPSPVWIYGHIAGLDLSWARDAYDLAGASSMLRLDDHTPAPDAIARWVDRGE